MVICSVRCRNCSSELERATRRGLYAPALLPTTTDPDSPAVIPPALCSAQSPTFTGFTLMAEVEPLTPPPVQQQEEITSEGSGPIDATHSETDGEHEATDVVEAPSEPEEPADAVAEETPVENGVSEGGEKDAVVDDVPKENMKEATSPPASPARKITAKSSISVKPPSSKAVGAPPTPLVKKVRCHVCSGSRMPYSSRMLNTSWSLLAPSCYSAVCR